jgi:hypothetical protein
VKKNYVNLGRGVEGLRAMKRSTAEILETRLSSRRSGERVIFRQDLNAWGLAAHSNK